MAKAATPIQTVPGDETSFRATLDTLPCALWLTDRAGNGSFFNRAFLDLTGLDRESVLADGWQRFIHPDDRDRLFRVFEGALHAEQRFELEHRMVLPTGKTIWLLVSAVPRVDAEEKFAGFIGTSVDITRRKDTETALTESEIRTRAILEHSPAAVFVRDRDGTYLMANQSTGAVAGMPTDALVGRKEARAHYLASDRLVLESGEPVESEETLTIDGKHRSFIVVKFPLRRPNGEPHAVVGIATDITGLKQREAAMREAQEAAEAASRAKSNFLANMSHELRTPLNAIIGFAEIMTRGLFGDLPDRYRDYADDIAESGRHLLSVIEDILDLSKVESGVATIQNDEVDIASVMASVKAMILPTARDAGVNVAFQAQPGVHLLADRRKIAQILINLVSNSVKFTPRGGEAVTSAHIDTTGRVVLEVADTGIGMDHRGIEIALADFGQVDIGPHLSQHGTGLGLPLAKKLAELHGAKFLIRSAPRQGTTITIVFPADRTAISRKEPPENRTVN